MVEHPAEYPWSRYAANAQGEPSSLVTPHHLYRALGPDENARQLRYRELFRFELDPGLVDEIRAATNCNYALGSAAFQAQAAKALARQVTQGKSGRPSKRGAVLSQDLFERK